MLSLYLICYLIIAPLLVICTTILLQQPSLFPVKLVVKNAKTLSQMIFRAGD